VLKSLRHIFYPIAARLLPDEPSRRIVGGLPSYFIRILPELLALSFYLALILLLELGIAVYLLKLVELFKLDKVFRVDFLTIENFAWLGAWARKGLVLLWAVYGVYRLLMIWGTELYLTANAVVLLIRLPLYSRIQHVPLRKIRLVTMEQWPGERIFTTGKLIISFSEQSALEVPMVPFVEQKMRLLTSDLPE
jgi:hypothetical protein